MSDEQLLHAANQIVEMTQRLDEVNRELTEYMQKIVDCRRRLLKYEADSRTLNNFTWRLGVALGHIAAGDAHSEEDASAWLTEAESIIAEHRSRPSRYKPMPKPKPTALPADEE